MRPLPFEPGEELHFRAGIPRFGGGGKGVMRVVGPERVRDIEAWALDFEFTARVAFSSVTDHTISWLDPERMAALRFFRRERSPISRTEVEVELFPEERAWIDGEGRRGESPTDTPLDELSFLYWVRTLPLENGSTCTVRHHFDEERNPVVVSVLGRSRTHVPAGAFDVVEVEMQVRDPDRFGGEGRVRMHLTDDERRLPVRIETAIPIAGRMILTLDSWKGGT